MESNNLMVDSYSWKNLMMFIQYKIVLVITAVLPLLVDGQMQQQVQCTGIQIQVETLARNYQLISDNTATMKLYRPVNITDLTVRCQCIGGNETLHWTYPSQISAQICSNKNGICITNQNGWLQLNIPIVKKKHEGAYNCYSQSAVAMFSLFVFGAPVIKQPQHDTEVPIKDSVKVTLQCRAAGHGSLIYYWEKKVLENWITVDDNNITSYTTNTSGQYRCNVTNEAGSDLSPVTTIFDPKPVIITHPVNTTIKALTNITFTCSASHVHGVTHSYSWYRSNGDIPSTRSTGQNTNTLTITRAIPADEGMYYCIATNDGGSTSSRSASLTVDDELSIIVSPLNQTVSEGGVATFTATATGIKTREFEYEWFKVIEEDLITIGMNKQLTINNVRIEDKGNYYCIITNEWNKTKESTRVQLSVNAASSVFTIHPQHQFIHNKHNAVFECVANGSESLKITWIKNTENVANSHFDEVSHKSVLKVNEAMVNDSGVYQCIATNADNETVYSQPAELLILPSMNTHPDNVTVLTGQSVNLTCSATGTDVVYHWMRNGAIISDDNSNVLRINEIKQSDDGTYQCIASNKGGNATSNPAMIKVYDKPSVIPLPHEMLGVLGEEFEITCNATNDKDASHNMMFTWMIPDGVDYNVKMTSEDDDHTASSTLYISRLARSDNGTYKCYVTNNNDSSGNVVTSTTVIVKERPSPPLNFDVFNYDAKATTSLLLIWNEPLNHNGKIHHYTVYWSDGEMAKSVNVFNFNGSYILKDLMPSTKYSLYVRAVTLIGINERILEGNSSVTVTATTSAKGPENDNCTSNMLMMQVFMILLGVSLACCLGLLILALILYKKNTQLKKKIKSTDKKIISTIKTVKSPNVVFRSTSEKLTAPNPVYSSPMTNITDQDAAVDNPMYQSASKRITSTYHEYEMIPIDSLVAKHLAS